MIEPSNKKLQSFHFILSLSFYLDVSLTCLCIANWEFRKNRDENFLNHSATFGFVVIMQLFEIILRFFEIEIVEIMRYERPDEIAYRYVFSWDFVTDVISVVPYNLFNR